MNGVVDARSFSLPPEAQISDRLDGERLVQLLRRNLRMILAVVVLVVLVTAAYLSQQQPVYRAVSAMVLMNSELRINQVDTQLESYELTRTRVETELDRLRSRSFVERVADKLDLFKDTSYLPVEEGGPKLGTPERRRAVIDKLLDSYQPQRSGESLVIYIEAHASTPVMAARIANGVVESFIRQSVEVQTRTLEQSTEYLRGQVNALAEQITQSQLEIADLIRDNVLDDAELPVRLRRERSYLLSMLSASGAQASDPTNRERLQDEFNEVERQLAARTHAEMQLNRLEQSIDLLGQRYQTMVERLSQIEPKLGQVEPDARQVTKAETPFEPSWPNMPTTLALAVPGGLLLGFVMALMRSAMDRQIWTGTQAIRVSQLPNLGNLPRIRRLGGLFRRRHRPAWFLRRFPHSQYSEALRTLMTAVGGPDSGGVPPVTMITSPLEGDGKSTTTASIGAVAAIEGMRVLLLDFDTGQSGARELLGLSGPLASLNELSEGQRNWREAIAPVPGFEGFDVIGFDSRKQLTPRTLVAFRDGPLAEMRDAYDIVLLDTPPALGVSDAARLGMLANAALVVVRSGMTSEYALQYCVDILQNSGVRLIGTVVNGIEPRHFSRINTGRADARY